MRACWEDGTAAAPVEPIAVGLGLLEAPPLQTGLPAAETRLGRPPLTVVAVEPPVHRLRWVDVEA